MKKRFELNRNEIIDTYNGLFSGVLVRGGLFTFEDGSTIDLVDCMNIVVENDSLVDDLKVGVLLVGINRDARYKDLSYIEGLAKIEDREELLTSVYLEKSFSYDEDDIHGIGVDGFNEYLLTLTFGPVLVRFSQWYSKRKCKSQWKSVDVYRNADQSLLDSIKFTDEQKDLFASLPDRKKRLVIEAMKRI